MGRSTTTHVELSLRICKDLWANFPWGSVKIVPLLRKDNCRSARIFTDVQGFSVQIFQEIFSGASGKQYIAFLGFFNKCFCWPILSQLKVSIAQNSWAGNLFPITVILVSGECSVLVIHYNLSISLELSRSGFSILRGPFAILTSFWRMKFDMWQPSGLVEVLIECCGCNILGKWFAGVVLVIARIRYSKLLVWLIFNKSWNICKDLYRSVQIRTEFFLNFK